jgi:hypothetical protein
MDPTDPRWAESMFFGSDSLRRCLQTCKTLLPCFDGWYGTKTLCIVRSDSRRSPQNVPVTGIRRLAIADQARTTLDLVIDFFLASFMDNTRRDALKSVSRVATKVVAKSADVLSQIASTNSSDPDDLASTSAGPAPSPAKETGPVNRGQLIKHRTRSLTVDVPTELGDA